MHTSHALRYNVAYIYIFFIYIDTFSLFVFCFSYFTLHTAVYNCVCGREMLNYLNLIVRTCWTLLQDSRHSKRIHSRCVKLLLKLSKELVWYSVHPREDTCISFRNEKQIRALKSLLIRSTTGHDKIIVIRIRECILITSPKCETSFIPLILQVILLTSNISLKGTRCIKYFV